MRLETGTEAPDFTTKDLDGNEVSLSGLRGKPVWLSFFRYAACPLCAYRVHELLAQWDHRFGAYDFTLLTVWQSKPEKLEEIRERHTPHFTLIPDPEMNVYAAYGVEKGLGKMKGFGGMLEGMKGARKIGVPLMRAWEGPPTRAPADFLIDPDGILQVSFYGENVNHMIPLEDASAFLSRYS